MKRQTIRSLAMMVTLIVILVGLAACSAKSSGDSSMMPGDYNENVSAGMDGKPSEEIKPEAGSGEYERKIIRTVNMSCESKAFDAAVNLIMSTLDVHGGYVEKSSSIGTTRSVAPNQGVHSARHATYTLRVPAEHLDAFLTALRQDEGIRILSQDMSSNEITGSYYDTKTRLETLTAEKDALTAMLSGFTDYSDISAMLQVQERLYNVIEEMEVMQTKLDQYDSQVAMSTVNMTLTEVVEYTATQEPTFGERIGEAFVGSWTAFGEGCQDFAVWFVEALPTLLVMAVFATVLMVIIIRLIRKDRARKQPPADKP